MFSDIKCPFLLYKNASVRLRTKKGRCLVERTFENELFGNLRVIEENGSILFCGTDVTNALGYKNSRRAIDLHCKGVTKRYTLTAKGRHELQFVTEGDVYRLIVKSKLPAAERYEQWVMDGILPTIRRTGGYVADADSFIEWYFPAASDEVRKAIRFMLDQWQKKANDLSVEDFIRAKVGAGFASAVSAAEEDMSVGDFAKLMDSKGLRMGRTRLYAFLREKKYLTNKDVPYQKYIDDGTFAMVEKYGKGYCGGIRKAVVITAKGQVRLYNALKGEE